VTRKSKRELEGALDDMASGSPSAPIDVRQGVSADFVTYAAEGPTDEDAPEGHTFDVVDTGEGAIYHVAREDDGHGGTA